MATLPIPHNGGLRFQAFHPADKPFPVAVTRKKLLFWAKLGAWRLEEVKVTVSEVLEHPHAIFQGLRKEEDENKGPDGAGWWCFVGVPSTRFIKHGSGARKPNAREIFPVFVTDEDVVYNARWEEVENENNVVWMREEHPERFRRRIFPDPGMQGQSQ